MNDRELNAKLKSARAPRRDDVYWELFPLRALAAARSRRTVVKPGIFRTLWPEFAWMGGIACACLLAGFWIQHETGRSHQVMAFNRRTGERTIQSQVVHFSNQVRSLMLHERGVPPLVIAVMEDKP